MPEQEAPYDPYIPSGQAGAQQQGAGGNARTQALQAIRDFSKSQQPATGKSCDNSLGVITQHHALCSEQPDQTPLASVCQFLMSFRNILVVLPSGDASVQPTSHLNITSTAMPLVRQQIDDTVGVMRDNINKVSQRGERLDALQDKTDNLAVSAQGFRRGANRVRKQMWWKDMKMRMCLIIGIIILLVIIIVPSVVATR
ncbi:hypothetical protein LB504_012676 [Fusarium proliferatum]|nr:hypothetical protein LB504_012676 [Fusarium proliferatum]